MIRASAPLPCGFSPSADFCSLGVGATWSRDNIVVADIAETHDNETKIRLFISYSRKDMAFTHRLEAALKGRGFEVLIDREEIYAFEDWWKRISSLIGRADTVVFVLSADAVKSDVALKEVEYAASLNKRFAPIVCKRVEDGTVPEPLRRMHFIFFDDLERFDASTERLTAALQTDIGWIRQHTEYGEAARRWSTAGRPGALLLRSPILDVAEHWSVSRPRGAPEPTDNSSIYRRKPAGGTHGAANLAARSGFDVHTACRDYPWPGRLDQSVVPQRTDKLVRDHAAIHARKFSILRTIFGGRTRAKADGDPSESVPRTVPR